MIITPNYYINGDGHLMVEGCDTVVLAAEYGTPLYIISKNELLDNIKRFKKSLIMNFKTGARVAYAGKALACKEVFRIINDENLYLDVVSEGELFTAVKSGFPMERIYFHGNNKLISELEYAVNSGVGKIVVDNLYELGLLNDLSISKGRVQSILLRVKPGVSSDTHSYIQTGGIDSKFGISLESEEIDSAIDKALECKGIKLDGIHCHIGSQILDILPYQKTAKVMANLYLHIKKIYGIQLAEINLGGGFGIPYREDMEVPDINDYLKGISETLNRIFIKTDVSMPIVTFEPGRSIIGSAGITLYTVGSIKNIKGVRKYLAVDGGMPDNPRYALYRSKYMAEVVNKMNDAKDFEVTIAGKCCETGDLIQEGISIQKAMEGDIIAVMPTGAFNYSMASNYNRIPRPAMVLADGNDSRIIVQRESLEDLIKNDI